MGRAGCWMIARALGRQHAQMDESGSELTLLQSQVEDALEKGDTRRGPRSLVITAVSAIEFSPRIPDPIITPVRCRSASAARATVNSTCRPAHGCATSSGRRRATRTAS